MWDKIKFITSQIGSFLWPLLKQWLIASAPLVQAAALSAVRVTINRYTGQLVSNSEKHEDAYGMILYDLQKQGLQLGQDYTESMVDTAIAAAVKALK